MELFQISHDWTASRSFGFFRSFSFAHLMQMNTLCTEMSAKKKRSLPFFCSPGSATLHGGINRDPGCRGEAGELTFQGEVQWWHVAMHQPRKRATGLGLKYLDVSSHLTHTVAYPKSDNPWMQLRLEIDQFKFGPFIIFSTQCWYSNNKPSRAPSHHHSYEWYKPSIWWVIYDIAVPTLRL